MIRALLRKHLAIPSREVSSDTRGFHPTSMEKQLRLEGIGRTFVWGYHAALERSGEELAAGLARAESEDRGFAFEGAAMAMAIEDGLIPFSRRLKNWLAGPGEPHQYMTYVGAGWAIARIPWQRSRAERRARELHRFLWPLVIDGFGFHQTYFHSASRVESVPPRGIETEAGRRAFYRGVGRGLWFVCGADPWKMAEATGRFEASQHRELWSGAGLACTYAGGVSWSEARTLARLAGPHAAATAQGACFAAKARSRAGNPAAHTDMACQVLCGLSSREASILSDLTHTAVLQRGGDYFDWTDLIQSKFSGVSARQP